MFWLVGLDHAEGLRTQLLSLDSELLVIRSICSVVFNHPALWIIREGNNDSDQLSQFSRDYSRSKGVPSLRPQGMLLFWAN